jgi:nucleoside-diphosphate-sugar epimerase
MIIGNGLIAQAFHQYINDDNILILASGVSSSKSCTEFDCNREERLVKEALGNCDEQILCIYFSSCGISNPSFKNETYYIHKKRMEGIVQEYSNKTIIFRLPYVVGGKGNPNTLFHYFVHKIKSKEKFSLWSGARRNIIDIDDIVCIVSYIIQNISFENEIINIANLKNNTIDEIVHEISNCLNIEARYSVVECDDKYNVDITKIEPIIKNIGLNFDDNYLKNVVKKYCHNI